MKVIRNFFGKKESITPLILLFLSLYIPSIFTIFYRIEPNILLAKFFHVAFSVFIWFNIFRTLRLLLSRYLRLFVIFCIFMTLNIGTFYLFYLNNIPPDLVYHFDSLTNYLDPSSGQYLYISNFYSYPFSLFVFQNSIFLNLFELSFFTLSTFILFHIILIYCLLFCTLTLLNLKSKSLKIFIFNLTFISIFNLFPLYSLNLGSIIFIESTLILFMSFILIFNSEYTYREKLVLQITAGTLSFLNSPAIFPQFVMLFLLFSSYFHPNTLWANSLKFLRNWSYKFSNLNLARFFFILMFLFILINIFSHYYDSNSKYIIEKFITSKIISVELFVDNYFLNGSYLNFFSFPFLLFLYTGVLFIMFKKRNYLFIFFYLTCTFMTYLGQAYYLDNFLGFASRAITTIWLGQVERLIPSLILFSLFVVSNLKTTKAGKFDQKFL